MSDDPMKDDPMNNHPRQKLSAYVDGELDRAERDAIREHLATCPACRTVVDDLERLVVAARGLKDQPPERDLWPVIAARLDARHGEGVVPIEAARRRGRRRFSFTWPELVAAAIAVIVLSAAAAWWALPDRESVATRDPAETIGTLPLGSPGIPVAYEEDSGYATAVEDLERVFAASRDRLDPETVRTVERNLMIIDEAIHQTREALRADPASTFLYNHLERTRRQKLEMLQQATLALRTSS